MSRAVVFALEAVPYMLATVRLRRPAFVVRAA
jgi:hypothetical protein